MSIKFQTVQEFGVAPFVTPDPRRPGCAVAVSLYNFDLSEIPELGVKLKDSGLHITRKNAAWDNHVFLRVSDGPPGYILFVFGPPDNTLNGEPVAFADYPTREDHRWPNVLFDLAAVQKVEFSSGALYYSFAGSRYVYVEGNVYNTEVQVQEYLSSEAFTSEFIATDEPIATPIDARWRGADFKFPACLHPKIEVPWFPANFTTTAERFELVDFNPNSQKSQDGQPQIFPQTNHLRWKAHVGSFEVRQLESGLYHGIRKTFKAPRLPKNIVV